MSAGTSEFFCLICLLLCSCTAQKIITAKHGQDVILSCKVPNIKSITAVEWKRPGLNPEYVLLYRDGRFDPENQHPSYQNRVDLQDKEMKDGDVSLILKNVKMEDTGTYECRVFKGQKYDLISIINLEVLPSDDFSKDKPCNFWTIVGVTVAVTLGVVILSAVGFVVYKILQNRTRNQEWHEVREQLKGNNPEINNLLQQKKRENEAQQNEQEELMRSHSDPNNQLQHVTWRNENRGSQLRKDENQKLMKTVGNLKTKLQNKKLKLTGPITVEEVDEWDCCIRLRNISSEEIQLEGWKVELQRNDSKLVPYTFNESLRLPAGKILTMGSKLLSTHHSDHVYRMWRELQDWNLGDKLQMNLISNKEENFRLL